jgi:hypothetical protein
VSHIDTLKKKRIMPEQAKPRSGKLKTSLAALATAFTFAAGGAALAATNNKDDAPTLWKTQTFDAVIELQPCPETGMCGQLHWMNPADKKLFEYFGDRSGREPGQAITADDVKALCGFTPKIDFKKTAENRWQGTMELRGMGMSVNVDATRIDDNAMRVDTSKLIIRQSETWTRVDAKDPRYPKCEKPKQ